jgi:hypothetical protein
MLSQKILNELIALSKDMDDLAENMFYKGEDDERDEKNILFICYDLGRISNRSECVLAEESKFTKKAKNTCDCNDCV